MLDAIAFAPRLTAFCRLNELGRVVVGQRLEPKRAMLACRVIAGDRCCRRCGCEGSPRDSVTRQLAHEPFGWQPATCWCGAPPPVLRLRSRVAAGHDEGGRAASAVVAARGAEGRWKS